MQGTVWQVQQNFNPRPPRGGRPASHPSKDNIFEFQSTPSARRATRRAPSAYAGRAISIHALREEGDPPAAATASPRANFNPRPPRGGRHKVLEIIHKYIKFQSTPSARRATCPSWAAVRVPKNFNPRPPRGGRHASRSLSLSVILFQSTPSARRATSVAIFR